MVPKLSTVAQWGNVSMRSKLQVSNKDAPSDCHNGIAYAVICTALQNGRMSTVSGWSTILPDDQLLQTCAPQDKADWQTSVDSIASRDKQSGRSSQVEQRIMYQVEQRIM